MTVEPDLRRLAKYPFLTQAKAYVGSLGLSMEELLSHPVYSACVEEGRERFLGLMKGEYSPDLDDKLSMQLTILGYPIARIIANSLKNRFLFEKYAKGEAEVANRLLGEEDQEVVDMIVGDLDVKYGEGVMPLVEYLRLSRYLVRESGKWKLVNRIVDAGMVRVNSSEFKTLVGEAVKLKVMEPVDVRNIPERLKVIAKNLKSSLTGSKDVVDIKKVDQDALPECIRNMVSMIETGAASHNAMFIVATFFLNLGLSREDVLSIFSRSPGYKEDLAIYQIEFLSGEKGGTEYTCPSCETIKSYGLGCAECTFKHPLQRYRLQSRDKRRRKTSIKRSGDNK